ncbi:MAG: DUF4115 domain-containing protein [Alphaproteobacteria bacterium]|nr:DUF4115 domain-containing protein [Alphaproteobacteria bacterium]
MASSDKTNTGEQHTATGVGAMLKASRLRLGDELRDVADILKIRYVYLEAIEAGKFEELPGDTYTLGFIRAYAEHLGLDSEEIIRRFKTQETAGGPRSHLAFPEPIPETSIPGGAIIFIGVVVAVLAYGAWYVNSTEDGFFTEMIAPLPERLAKLTGNQDADDGKPETMEPVAPTKDAEVVEKPESETMEPEKTTPVDSAVTDDKPAEAAPETAVETPAEAPTVASIETQTPETPVEPTPEPTAEANPPEPSEPTPETPVVEAQPEPVAEPVAQPESEKVIEPVEAPAPETVATPEPASEQAAVTTPAPEPKPEPTPEPKPEPVRAPAVVAMDMIPSARSTTEATTTPEITPEPVTESQTATTTPTPEPAPVATVEKSGRVVVRAKTNSWIQVRDDNANELLLTRLLRAGDSYAVPDRAGLMLSTGNAGALEILVDGDVVPSIGDEGTVRRKVLLDADKLKAGTAVNE